MTMLIPMKPIFLAFNEIVQGLFLQLHEQGSQDEGFQKQSKVVTLMCQFRKGSNDEVWPCPPGLER